MKNKKLLILVLMSVMATSAIFAHNTTAKTYEIGDDGPGGGIVFYHSIEGFEVYQEDGSIKKCHYLEVSKFDLGKITWCTMMKNGKPCCSLNTTLTELGTGYVNTLKIIKSIHHGRITKENCAALACYSYSTENTKAGEWFLPSKDELNLLYRNLKKRVIASNTTGHNHYWSSSLSISFFLAFAQDFSSDGYNQREVGKDDTYSVRAVRAF
jgi:hypothetical protein